MADNFVWLGGSGSFGVASNWEDLTAGTNPAATPPGATDTAEFTTGPGTITGHGTVANLQFLGALAWTIGGNAGITDTAAFLENDSLAIQTGATLTNSGASDVIDSNNTLTTASLLVTGAGSDFAVTGLTTWLYVGTFGNGSLSIANGASATADFLISLGGALGSSTVRVDGTSRLEIGTAGTATAGALTIDPAANGNTYQILGYGTVAATVVNNGLVSASSNAMGAALEITGAVTGSGSLNISSGFQSSPGTIVAGAVLQLDAAVGASQQVVFSFSSSANESPKLRLEDASAFAGTLANFSSPGDTLELVGDTVTGATVSGSTMTVTLSSGGPLSFNLGFGAPTTSQLLVSGSDIRILPIRAFDWTGATDHSFVNATNWNDTTDGVNPAATAPGTTDLASMTNAGSVSGTASVYQLSFNGTNTVTGALTALDSMTGTSGLLAVTGTLNAASANISGTLSVRNGGRVTSSGSVVMQPNALLAVDGSSFVEVGTAGTAVAGSLTVDNTGGTISGDGTLAAATVNNNGHITANYGTIGSNLLEITGAVTGGGLIELTNGYNAGAGTVVPGSILRLDSSVASSQQVTFDYSTDPGTAGTLQLVDPLAFAGTIDYFQYPGDTLDLIGKTVTGASVNGSTMTVSLTAGAPLTFNLGGALPTSSELIAVGSNVRVLPERLFDWIGASTGSFSNAANWDDTTDGANPAATAPGTTDIAAFVNAGAVSGNGTVYQLSFDGANTMTGVVTALNSLGVYSGSLTVTGTVAAANILNIMTIKAQLGGRITSGGAVTMVAGGVISVDGSSAMEVGTAGTGTAGHLTVDATAGATIIADGTLAAAIVNNGEIDAASGNPGSNVLEVTGAITGSGTIAADHGYHAGGTLVPGGVLQLDSAVGGSQSVQFDGDSDPSESATVVLMDPIAFAGTLANFAAAGDTLELNGQSLTGATVSGSTMTVTRTAGSPLLFNLSGFMPTSSQLLAIGSDIRVVPIRELDWTGAGGNAFGNALNWNDVTNGLNPAASAPGITDLASLTNAGSVTGGATVYQLSFTGTNTMTGTLAALNSLTANAGSVVVTGSLSAASVSVLGAVSAKSGGRISSSGTVVLSPGGAIAVDGGSSMEVGTAGGAATGALTIDAASAGLSGDGTLAAAVVNNALITTVAGNAGSNLLEITGAVTGTGSIGIQNGFDGGGGSTIPGAILRLDAAVVSSQMIEFGATANPAEEPTLMLADPATFAGTMDNFDVAGDTLELVGRTVTGASIVGTTMTVTVTGGGPFLFNLAGTPSTTPLHFSGSDITVAPCFVEGTMILTERGEVAVETLRAGDVVVTHLGFPRAVRWIGHRRIDISRHADPSLVRPISIAAEAFPGNKQHRDLLVSPDHALFIDDMLIPAKLLVNGASIVAETDCRWVTYYHVELEEHDVLLAEGLPAESYLDTGNRASFANCEEPTRLHADFAGAQWMRETYSCAPLIADPARVEPVWRMLTERAEALGWTMPEPVATVEDPDLHVLAGARRIEPLSVRDGRYVFAIPSGDVVLRLMSRAARPYDASPWVDDHRQLGVLVRRLTGRHGGEVAMDGPMPKSGWHEVEWHNRTPVRWTAGDARLPVRGPGLLEVELAGTMHYAEPAAPGWGAALRRRA